MTWAKISDDFSDDCETLSDSAFRLHVEGLAWNGRKLLDCIIPIGDLRRFAKNPKAIDELLATGWWSREGDMYVIRHHSSYQRLRVDVLAQQAVNTRNGAKGGRPRKQREIHSLSDLKTERDRTGQDRHLGEVITNQIEVADVGVCPKCFKPIGSNVLCPKCADS